MTAETAPARLIHRPPRHWIRFLTGLAWTGLLVAFALTALDAFDQARLWENTHWTICAAAAAGLALLGALAAPAHERRARGAIAVGFALYLGGQLAWDAQVALNVLTVPAVSDLLYVSSAIPIAYGFLTLLLRRLTATQRLAFAIDATTVALTLLLLLWVSFGTTALVADDPLAGVILMLYPVSFIGGASIAALAALRIRVGAKWGGINLLLLGLAATGAAWVVWMSEAITALPAVGSPVNYAFSVAWLAAGVGAARLSFRQSESQRMQRTATAVETLFPMMAVAATIAAILVAQEKGDQTIVTTTQVGGVVIVFLALVRQSMLMLELRRLAEHDRMLHDRAQEAVAAHRESAERYRQVVDVFARLGEQLSFAADESALIRGGVAALRVLVPCDGGSLLLANASQDRLVIGTTWGSAPGTAGDSLEGMTPATCLGIRRGSLHHVADAADELALPCPAHTATHGSSMCVPMLALGQMIGVLHLAAGSPGAFEVDHERQAQRVAEQVALAIANARLVRTMESMALTDPLTRLHNARFFDPFLDRELAAAERDGQPLGVIMIDLDQFKAFNDTHGHSAGDEALRVFARTALTVLRDSDTLARYGGEEFVVAARGADIDATVAVAERLRAALEGASVEVGPGRYAPMTASLGVASTTLQGHDRLRLLRAADRALYRAKRLGRNRVVAAGAPRSNERVAERPEGHTPGRATG